MVHALPFVCHIDRDPLRMGHYLRCLRNVHATGRGKIRATFSSTNVRHCVLDTDWAYYLGLAVDPDSSNVDSGIVTHCRRIVRTMKRPFLSSENTGDIDALFDALFDTITAAENDGEDWRFQLRFLHQCTSAEEQQEIVCAERCDDCLRIIAEGEMRGVYL